jgi:hypothetical protein
VQIKPHFSPRVEILSRPLLIPPSIHPLKWLSIIRGNKQTDAHFIKFSSTKLLTIHLKNSKIQILNDQ